MSNAIDLQLIADFGGTNLWPMIALSNIAQGSAVLAMICLQKRDEKAREVSVPSCISCYLGVTEPAMFGVNLKYGFPFICGMIGSSLAAVVSVVSGIRAQAVGVGGIPGILSIQPQYMGMFAVCMMIVVAVPFGLTYVVGKRKGVDLVEAEAGQADGASAQPAAPAAQSTESAVPATLRAFATGRVISVEEVPDQVFASRALGDGIAVWPEDGILKASADGTVAVVMEGSLHACGVVLDNGMELLYHVGLDTVDMKGDGFKAFVKAGDRVKAGDVLLEFDREKIRAAGHQDVVIMVVTNMGAAGALKWTSGEKAVAGNDVIAEIMEERQ